MNINFNFSNPWRRTHPLLVWKEVNLGGSFFSSLDFLSHFPAVGKDGSDMDQTQNGCLGKSSWNKTETILSYSRAFDDEVTGTKSVLIYQPHKSHFLLRQNQDDQFWKPIGESGHSEVGDGYRSLKHRMQGFIHGLLKLWNNHFSCPFFKVVPDQFL